MLLLVVVVVVPSCCKQSLVLADAHNTTAAKAPTEKAQRLTAMRQLQFPPTSQCCSDGGDAVSCTAMQERKHPRSKDTYSQGVHLPATQTPIPCAAAAAGSSHHFLAKHPHSQPRPHTGC